MTSKLNLLLADLVVEHRKLQSMHWYVKGADFFQAHAQLEAYYDELSDMIDEVAELILQVGGKPQSSLAEYLDTATIAERADEYLSSDEAIRAVITDYTAILAEVKAVKAAADEAGSALVSAKMDEYIASFSKHLWMLNQRQA